MVLISALGLSRGTPMHLPKLVASTNEEGFLTLEEFKNFAC